MENLVELLKVINNTGILRLAAKIDVIDGWLTYNEGVCLYFMSAFGPGQGQIVEIGSFKGRSTVWLATASKQTGREKVIAIDPHIGSPEHQEGGKLNHHMPTEGNTYLTFQRNLSVFSVSDWVLPLVMPSEQAARQVQEPIRLLFVDGDHAEESVRKDFTMWEPKVITGGIIAFHDVYENDSGVDIVVNSLVRNSPQFRVFYHVDGLLLAQKLS